VSNLGTVTDGNASPYRTDSRQRPEFDVPLDDSGDLRVAFETTGFPGENVSYSDTRDTDASSLASTVRRAALRTEPPIGGPAYFIDGLEKWEGEIEAIYARHFSARLVRILGGEAEEFEAEFERNLISSGDMDIFQEGAAFYLTVRTVTSHRGPRRTAMLVMRRPGYWTESDIVSISAQTAALASDVADAF